MVEVLGAFKDAFISIYQDLFKTLPFWAQNFLNLFFWSLLMVVYAIFIWNFYRWIAKKDLIDLNLRKYSNSEHDTIKKFVDWGLYFLEYIIILPFLVFVWFSLFTIFLMLLTENLQINTILIMSVTIITAIRMSSYYKEDLARDLAKLIPLTLLAVAATSGLFNFERVVSQFFEIPTYLSHIWTYLLFIILIEFILRVIDVIFSSFQIYNEKEVRAEDSKD